MRYLRFLSGIFLAIVLFGCTGLQRRDGELTITGQHPEMYKAKITKTIECGYLLYLPPEYGKEDKEWPMILFLHGVGERGNDLEKVKMHGPPKLVSQGKDFPFVIVSPQCPDGEWWNSEVLVNLVDYVVENYSIDPDRVYLTGLSMGGFGTWGLSSEYPDRFAAVAPICGGGIPKAAKYIKGVKELPYWVFHGAKDSVVPISESETMVKYYKEEGVDIRFTIYPDATHDSWTETYNNPELYEWFLKHKRKK